MKPFYNHEMYCELAFGLLDSINLNLKPFRTLEFLMRHLARVANLGHETEMHSKNLAIVWAPNLLRFVVI